MKALLLKDYYVIGKQMKFFLVLMAVFAVLPTTSMASFSLIYSAMMPYTALAYDERSKWDTLACMMPYTALDVVAAKYVLGYICTGGMLLIAILARLLLFRASETPILLFVASAALLFMAVTLPLMFKWGVEKGRMFFLILMVAIAMVSSAAFAFLAEFNAAGGEISPLLPLFALVAAAICHAVSIPIAVRCYKNRER